MRRPPCQVCGNRTYRHVGDVDFNKTCEDARGRVFPPSTTAIEYRECTECGVAFAPWMLTWARERFVAEVYNDEYVRADPDAAGKRATANAAQLLARLRLTPPTAHLDYGGGDGALAKHLRAAGWSSCSYDPLYDATRPPGKYDLITAFEVVEHVPDVAALLADLDALAAPNAVLVFTTLLHDAVPPKRLADWWYLAPRNGHVMVHTRRSLIAMLARIGFMLLPSADNGAHTACRATVPEWYRIASERP